jgi:transposase
MIDYETFCKIKPYHAQAHLRISQIARPLGLHRRTVAYWLSATQYRRKPCGPRASKLDPFKPQIVRLLETHPYSAGQIFQRLQEDGFQGGYSTVKAYVHKVRPTRRPAFLTLAFAPGEAAQVDWGEYGTVQVGSTRRKLSFFIMVLCYSRLMYLEFTVSQSISSPAISLPSRPSTGCPPRS